MTTHIAIVPETGSTNADLLARLALGEPLAEGFWLVADRQTAGRGRLGRRWIDAPGNFMGSTVVRLLPGDPPPTSLSFLAALAVYQCVEKRSGSGQHLQLKWPNDLLLDGGKLCGLLLEREGSAVVIGIGVNLAIAPPVVDRPVGRHVEALGASGRDEFARDLADAFAIELDRWRQLGAAPLFARWLAAAHPVGTALQVNEGEGVSTSGSFAGLESDGALRLRLPDGAIRVIRAGDVMLED